MMVAQSERENLRLSMAPLEKPVLECEEPTPSHQLSVKPFLRSDTHWSR
jgi:hypothetical protein